MRFTQVLLVALGAASVVVSGAMGCGSDSDGDAADPTSSGTGPGGAACTPPAACTDVKSDCIALVDNAAAAKPALRISYLDITTPPELATVFVQNLILDGVLLDRKDCFLDGKGTFTWLLEFDPAAGKLKTGGAPPSTPDAGYCFLQGELDGKNVAPIVADATVEGGKFSAEEGLDVVVPIYLDAAGSSYVLLPLKKARIFDATISEDYNCIGQHNADGLLTVDQCLSSLEHPAFKVGASLDGHITLEDADTVVIKELGQTLCTLLSGTNDGAMAPDIKKCVRDANMAIEFKGDWCSETNMAGGCQDAVALGAKFSAHAVKVNGDCK